MTNSSLYPPGIIEGRVKVAAPDGAMDAFLVRPDTSDPVPGVVVIIEAFGLVGSIEDTARRLAADGYAAVVPDLFYREAPNNTAAYDDIATGAALQEKLVGRGPAFLGDVAAAMDMLAMSPGVIRGKFGVVGFCMGGSLSFATACGLPDRVGAAACFYGAGTSNLLDFAAAIRAPLMFSYGDQDPYIPVEEVGKVEDGLIRLGLTYELVVYEGAGHGFMNELRADHHPEAASAAWTRLLRFFRINLVGLTGG